jgi:A/G-specific adenine glycosylase
MKAWQGLGYYSRARNMHEAAKFIVEEGKALFPTSYDELIKLKGVGVYTASAIASIAFNEKKAVVDGNVYRVLSRIFGIADPIDTLPGKKLFQELADKLIPEKHAGDFNQALMEYGATVCKPKSPNCSSCIFLEECVAARNQLINVLPQKSRKTLVRKRYLNYVFTRHGNKVLIGKRQQNDIWKNLYEFYPVSIDKPLNTEKSIDFLKELTPKKNISSLQISETFKHQLSHQTLFCTIVNVRVSQIFSKQGYKWVLIKDLQKFAFPRLLEMYLTREGFLLPQKAVNLKRKKI